MKTQDFVKKEYPKAVAEKKSEGKIYWLIRKTEKGDFISVAKTKQKAWEEAKNFIIRNK
jgi:hypothetical protein